MDRPSEAPLLPVEDLTTTMEDMFSNNLLVDPGGAAPGVASTLLLALVRPADPPRVARTMVEATALVPRVVQEVCANDCALTKSVLLIPINCFIFPVWNSLLPALFPFRSLLAIMGS